MSIVFLINPGLAGTEAPVGNVRTAIIALIGQSNMVGRNGPIDVVLDATDPDIFEYQEGTNTIVTASDPLDHFDGTAGTIGPGLSLAKRYMALNPEIERVILIPAADGGTSHVNRDWNRLDAVYAAAVDRINAGITQAKFLYPNAVLEFIAHHQGEGEINGTATAATDEEFRAVKAQHAKEIRQDITDADENTPIIFGGLSEDWVTAEANDSVSINSVMSGLGTYVTKYAYASSTGFDTETGDEQHFSAVGYREMGVAMADAVSTAIASSTVLPTLPARPSGGLLFHFDHTGVADGNAVTENSGNDIPFSNRKVTLVGGDMAFRQAATNAINARLFFDPNDFTPLTDQDFSLRGTIAPESIPAEDPGIVGIYNTSTDDRSWLVRLTDTGNALQFFWSSDGTAANSGTLTSLSSIPTDGSFTDFEVRRVGTLLELYINGVLEASSTANTSTFFDTGIGVTIGDHNNDYEEVAGDQLQSNPYHGLIRSLTLEILDDSLIEVAAVNRYVIVKELDNARVSAVNRYSIMRPVDQTRVVAYNRYTILKPV